MWYLDYGGRSGRIAAGQPELAHPPHWLGRIGLRVYVDWGFIHGLVSQREQGCGGHYCVVVLMGCGFGLIKVQEGFRGRGLGICMQVFEVYGLGLRDYGFSGFRPHGFIDEASGFGVWG